MDMTQEILGQLRETTSRLNALEQACREMMDRLVAVEMRSDSGDSLEEEFITPLGTTTKKELIDLICEKTVDGNEYAIRIGQVGVELPPEVYRFLFEQAR